MGARCRSGSWSLGRYPCYYAARMEALPIASRGMGFTEGARITMTVYEMRTYTVQVGKMPEAIRLYSQFGYPALHKGGFDQKLVGYFIADTGTLHQLVHLWKFDDDADRRAHWAALFADTDFIDGFAAQFRPLVQTQEVKLLPRRRGGHIPKDTCRLQSPRRPLSASQKKGLSRSYPGLSMDDGLLRATAVARVADAMLKASCGMASVKRVCVPVVPWRETRAGKGHLLASAPPGRPRDTVHGVIAGRYRLTRTSEVLSMSNVPAEVLAQLAPTGRLRAGINMSNFLLVVGQTPSGDPIGPSPSMAAAIADAWVCPCT